MAFNTLKVEDKEFIKIVTLNRPENLNAISYELSQEFHSILDALHYDNYTRVLIVTGEGRAFCAGADLKERSSYSEEEKGEKILRMMESVTGLHMKMEMLEIPTIAAIDGFCLGGGMELALGCDIRVSGEGSLFGFPEINYASYPGGDAPTRLPRLIGVGIAKELMFTGRRFDAAEAEKIGFVEHLVPAGKAMDKAMEIAEQIAANGPLAMRALKNAINYGLRTTPEVSHEMSIWLRRHLDISEDYAEGLRARAEKRPPVYKGR